MKNPGISEQHKIKSGVFTEKEIWGQPELWQKVYDQMMQVKQSVVSFLEEATAHKNLNIILTGAGSSAFIGLSLLGTFNRNFRNLTSAVSTTDLVTHPMDFLSPDNPVLLISFARSGNSPESIAAVTLADQICPKVYHIIITCDGDGALAYAKTKSPKYTFILPTEANDKSLAMTGSYSGMLLAGLLMAKIKEIEKLKEQVLAIRKYAVRILEQSTEFRQIAKMNFERALFLGSGPLYGTATESHLKVQELTGGKVICKRDTFLGLRHGPKIVIDSTTLVFLLFSNQHYVLDYETDLLNELKSGPQPLFMAGLIESKTSYVKLDKLFVVSDAGVQIDEDFLPVCFILPAQMIGFFKSLQLGLNPDNPSTNGVISRVVRGVTIYPY